MTRAKPNLDNCSRTAALRVRFEDWRQPKDALNRLHALAGKEPLLCYAEGLNGQPLLSVKNRLQVEPTATLAILTPPPDFATLQGILKQAGAQRVIFMRLDQPDDSPDGFLRRLSGLLRYAISHYNGQTSLDQLAAALGQNPAAVELGLTWWQAHGDILLQITEQDDCVLEKNPMSADISSQELSGIAQRLNKVLCENAAFRSFYMRAEPDFLLRKG